MTLTIHDLHAIPRSIGHGFAIMSKEQFPNGFPAGYKPTYTFTYTIELAKSSDIRTTSVC